MSINWFEGARRITALVAGVVLLSGGAITLFSGGESAVVLETASPSNPFHWTLKRCDFPDQQKYWGGKTEFNHGDPRTVTACFRMNREGRLGYAFGPESQRRVPQVGGQPLVFKVKQLLDVHPYSDVANEYMLRRMNDYQFSQSEFAAIGRDQWLIGWVRFWVRVSETMPWIASLLLGLWVFAAGVGWITRGFAGIPYGSDFRVDNPNHANAQRSSNEWIVLAICGALAVWGITWVLSTGTTAASPELREIFSSLFGKALLVVGVVVCLGVGLAGGWGLRELYYKVRKQAVPMAPADDIKPLVVVSVMNALLVGAVSWPLDNYTVAGQWSDQLDKWSRSNGFSDGPTSALFALCLLWPFIPLYAMHKRKRPFETLTSTSAGATE